MRRLRFYSLTAALVLVGSLAMAQVGCMGSASTKPVTQSQRVATATFENDVLKDAENRLMDAFDAKLLDPSLHDDLDVYVKSARAAADRLTALAKDPTTTDSAFQLVLDQFFAALGPIADANAQAAAAKHAPTTQASVKVLRSTSVRMRASAVGPTDSGAGGHVMPSVISGNDASRFNTPPGR